jgi:hypothetical protein
MSVNERITVVLAAAAGLAWVAYGVLPVFNLVDAYPDVQTPMAVSLTAAACFGWGLSWLERRRGDGETRCRRCGHILRGLSEPRCPECGERI